MGGNTIVAAWNKASLSPHILDPTFASVARQFNLTVMEEDQIQQLAGDDVPVVTEDGGSGTNAVKTFPNEEYVYQILNTVVKLLAIIPNIIQTITFGNSPGSQMAATPSITSTEQTTVSLNHGIQAGPSGRIT